MPHATGAAARSRTGLAWQVFGFLGGMTVYAVYHLAGTPMVPLACKVGSTWMISAASAAAALLIVGALVVSWRMWRTGRRDAAETGAVSDQRTAFLGISGFILNALALAIILSVELHVQVLDPCLPG